MKRYHLNNFLAKQVKGAFQQSSSLKVDLRDYQKNAVEWMMWREGVCSKGYEKNDFSEEKRILQDFISYIFIPVELKDFESDNSAIKTAFMNRFTGELCWKRPEISEIPRGGILCDSMGLGKTIEVLSLILSHQCPPDSIELGRVSTAERKSLNESRRSKKCPSPCEFATVQSDTEEKDVEVKMELNTTFPDLMTKEKEILSLSQEEIKEALPSTTSPQKSAVQQRPQRIKSATKRKSRASVDVEDSPLPPKKAGALFNQVKILYDTALNDYKASKFVNSNPKFLGHFFDTNVGRKAFFECTCGEYNDDDSRLVR